MRVLHVIAGADIGGAERVVQALATGHRRRGLAVWVAAVLDEGRPADAFLEPLREGGVEVAAIRLPARQYFRERRAVAELCHRIKPAVMHTHGYRCDVVDSGVARKLGIPTVTTVHGFTGGDAKNRFYQWLQRRAYRRFDTVVAVSRPQVARLVSAGVPRARIHLLRNVWVGGPSLFSRLEARRQLGVASPFLIGWVGRLSREKGLDVLLNALALLSDVDLTLSVFGDGREREALVAQAGAAGLDARIGWHGSVPKAERLFAAFDCLVLSSRAEGTPMVLFEAMAAGVPIVATRVGGVPDVVSAGEGLLVPPEDPRALARAIRSVHDDREAAEARACAARTRLAKESDIETWLAQYEALYRAVEPSTGPVTA
jgi:glycosyltransferase involved in cell wall biosynthesis